MRLSSSSWNLRSRRLPVRDSGRTARVLVPLSVVAVAAFVACSEASNGSKSAGPRPGEGVTLPDGTVFTRAALLASFSQCVTVRAATFQGKAAAFDGAAADAASAPGDATKLEAARLAWREAIDVWQTLEVMQYGPAASRELPGGQSLRELIYAWPLGARCSVEQTLVDKSYETADFAKSPLGARGLTAAEYLLHYAGTDNACPETSTINADGSWSAIPPEELGARKLAYARAAAADVALRAQALVDAWDPAKGDFQAAFTTAGKGSRIYTSERIAINAVSDAMFYLEADVKDRKLAHPAGISNCATPTCPESVESPWGHRSKEHVRNNLLGFRALFAGCGPDDSGLGFEDYLVAVGAGDLASEMRAAIDGAVAAVDALGASTLEEALASNLGGVQALHAAVKKVTDLLRSQFITVLDLEIAKRVEGDTD